MNSHAVTQVYALLMRFMLQHNKNYIKNVHQIFLILLFSQKMCVTYLRVEQDTRQQTTTAVR